jgi:uncharacterized protein YndB with AHSA1/START domain
MAVWQKHPNAPWLYDHTTNDLVGVKDPDGSEFLWARTRRTGLFYNMAAQTLAANTPEALEFNLTANSDGVSLSAADTLTFNRGGIYNFTLTLQIVNEDNHIQDLYLWGKLNGTNIAGTTTKVCVTESHGGEPGATVLERSYFSRMDAGDELQIMVEASSNQVSLTPVTATANHPAGPSAVLAVYEVAD